MIIGASSNSLPESLIYARKARDCGADGLMLMLPNDFKREYSLIKRFYGTVAEACRMPVFLQNKGEKGISLPVEVLKRLGEEIEHVQYVKEETEPQILNCERIINECSGVFKGFFSGTGGAWLFWDLERGVNGNMPGAPVVDVLMRYGTCGQLDKKRKHSNCRINTRPTAKSGKASPGGQESPYS